MKNNTQTKTETLGVEVISNFITDQIKQVPHTYPSLYSKDDVIVLLNRILNFVNEVMKSSPTIDGRSQEDVFNSIRDFTQGIDIDTYIDIDLNGRELEVEFYHKDFLNDLIKSVQD
jgi:hypothetical protein